MSDLIESRISEIRELASKLEDATMAMDLKVIRALVTRLKYAVSRAPSDLEALLAEREGMKAETEGQCRFAPNHCGCAGYRPASSHRVPSEGGGE